MNNVSTAMPYTIGSINVTFSGLYGKENGIDGYYKMLRLKKTIKNFPEIFQSQGYFTGCDVLTDKIIPNRGFEVADLLGNVLGVVLSLILYKLFSLRRLK